MIEHFEVLAEICKAQQVYLKPEVCTESMSNSPTPASASTEIQATVVDESQFFAVKDIVREARAGLKGDTAEELFSALRETQFANDHQRQLIINACGTYLLNNCHE